MNKFHDNLFRDSLYYLHPDCANDEKHIAMGRGQICGIVSVVMAMGNYNSEQALYYIVPFLPEKINYQCVPESWQKDLTTAITVYNQDQKENGKKTAVEAAKSPFVGRYARMVGLR